MERRLEVSTVYTSGTWTAIAGREEAFVEAWGEFAAWASQMSGARRLILTRDLYEEGRYVSFGEWSSEDAVHSWKGDAEFKEQMAQVLQHVAEFKSAELGLVASAEEGTAAEVVPTVRYERHGVATFAAPVERIFEYMRAGNHPHQAFKSHRLVGTEGNVVTVAVEAYNPDGSTTAMTVEHRLDPPNRIVNTMSGGHFDGGRFTLSYAAVEEGTKVDVEGDFPVLPGLSEADELAMIDGFFTMVLGEDAETIRTWSSNRL
jgi:heme-degrading monooxygenase HmoA